jgi:CheY-like chemotaxis protein
MPRSILIVDASPGFAGMLQEALTAVGFQCTLAHTGREAFQIASSGPMDLAIIDFHLPDGPPEDLVRAIQNIHPDAILLGIPPDNDLDNPVIESLGMQGALTKPFYLPDLVPQLAEVLGVEVPSLAEVFPEEAESSEADSLRPPPPKKSTRVMPWLKDTSRAAAWLDKLASENSVYACMILRGPELHAGAGALSRDKLTLLGKRVAEKWSNTPGGTIVQYIKISPEENELLLYSVSIAQDFDLTLIFDRKMSMTAARRRAKNFEKALEKPPATGTFRRVTGPMAAAKRKTDELAREQRSKQSGGSAEPHGP